VRLGAERLSMPRKTLYSEAHRRILIPAFKWEFLRRRDEYRRDWEFYQELLNQFKKEGGQVPSEQYFHGPFLADQELCEKWQIGFVGDSNDPYVRRNGKGKFLFLPNPFSCLHKTSPIEVQRSENGIPLAVGIPPQPIETLLDTHEGRYIHGVLQNRFEKEWLRTVGLKTSLQRRIHRTRLDSYPLFLTVWDLRQREHLSLKAIAKTLYPTQYKQAEQQIRKSKGKEWLNQRDARFEALVDKGKSDEEAAKIIHREYPDPTGKFKPLTDRILYNLKRANELIDGGYTEIS